MQYTYKIGIKAEDRDDVMLNDYVQVIVDGATGMVRNIEDPPLLEWKDISIELDSSPDRKYLIDTLKDWEIKVWEDSDQHPGGPLDEVRHDIDDAVKTAKDVLPEIEKRFSKSDNPKDRRFLKKMELLTKAFLEMVDGKDRLDKLLGDVDIAVAVELINTYEEPVVAPTAPTAQPAKLPEMLIPVKKKRVRAAK